MLLPSHQPMRGEHKMQCTVLYAMQHTLKKLLPPSSKLTQSPFERLQQVRHPCKSM